MSSRKGLDWILVGALSVGATVAFAACSDSIHLDPTPEQSSTATSGTGGGGGSTSSAGGTGDGGTTSVTTTSTSSGGGCKSNADCPNDPSAPQSSICDTAYGNCVECLVFSDCAGKPGTVCALGACTCPDGAESFCPAAGNQAARCVDLATSPADCGSCGHQCFLTCGGGKCTDAWEPTSTVGAPTPRGKHVAAWSNANQMVVWGGDTANGVTNTGGVYDPATGEWTAMSTANAPSARSGAKAVWATTTSEMLVWGGNDGSGGQLATGARFNPSTNTWKTIKTEGAPQAREMHTAIWTGAKMIVFGGYNSASGALNDGGIYDPQTDIWITLPTVDNTGGALPARYSHSAAWSGQVMIVWGGIDAGGAFTNSGYAFIDAAQSWNPISVASAPSSRARHTAVWSGTDMYVWGGNDGAYQNTGDYYNYANNVWGAVLAMPMAQAPIVGRQEHTAVVVPNGRMIVWGGYNGGYLGDGAILETTLNSWNVTPMPTAPAAPSAREYHTAVVTNQNKMLVWGGLTASGYTNTGAQLDPTLVQ